MPGRQIIPMPTRALRRKNGWRFFQSCSSVTNLLLDQTAGFISRGIYKQRAVAVKVVKIPDQDEKRREMELTLTKGEMPF